jgi:hypothetical protein
MQNDFFMIDLIIGAIVICCYYGLGLDNEKDESKSQLPRSTSQYQIQREQVKPIPGVSLSLSPSMSTPRKPREVQVLRGGEFVGNRMRFKVKVINDTEFTITDVKVYLLSYPNDALRLASSDDDETFFKIEPSGIRSPTFDFIPTRDCVKGDIIAGVSYIDERGIAHTMTAKPFVIRSVCDLLLPVQISPEDFKAMLQEHKCGEVFLKVTEWTPEEMFDKSLRTIQEANFYEVESKSEERDGIFYGSILGLAKGKYTGKSIGAKILISGPVEQRSASCTIQVTGEDQAMILPAINDLQERLNAWLCPLCGSPLTIKNVEDLKAGRVIICPFCSVSIGR